MAMTGRLKAGQDPDNPANRASNGLRLTKASPKSGHGVPAHTALGGRGVPACAAVVGQGVPAKIVNGSSGDDASFASKEEDNERNRDDKIAVEA